MELHTNFSIFRRFGFFFVYDKEWPKVNTIRVFGNEKPKTRILPYL